MFETVTEAKQKEGWRGFTSRHFGPVVDADLARDGIRDIALVLIGLSCLLGVVGWYLSGPPSLLVALAFGIPAAVLRFTPSRLAALVLFFLTAANATFALPRLFPWIFVLFAIRGVQLTFGYHWLLKRSASDPVPREL